MKPKRCALCGVFDRHHWQTAAVAQCPGFRPRGAPLPLRLAEAAALDVLRLSVAVPNAILRRRGGLHD